MRRFARGAIAGAALLGIAIAPLASVGSPEPAQAADSTASAFEQGFRDPGNDARPIMRWWIGPGRMTEAEVRREIESFADGGFAGVEIQGMAAEGVDINTPVWNETMKWILQAGADFGIQIDSTIGVFWPIATPEITDVDDIRAEQRLFRAEVDVTADAGGGAYTSDAFVLPATSGQNAFDPARAYEFVAVTAAKVSGDGTALDPATAIDLAADADATFDPSTGALEWTPPSEGTWKVFYFYRQSAGHMAGTQIVIDHMSADATKAVTDNWDAAMNSDPELKRLYEENAGSIFGDSFELKSDLWTENMLSDFEARRGYDLTPYLPAMNSTFSDIGSRVRDDLYTTMTELLAENHMGEFRRWAHSHNMTLRYQAYSSQGPVFFELTRPALETDIIEVESYAMSGTNPDAYRQLSGAVNLRGDQIFSAEAAEIGQDDWRSSWTDVQTKSGTEKRHLGFMYYANRLFAAGVNKTVFHGASYRFDDPGVEWPGYSLMANMQYGNEWDDKTPMWENVDLMTDSLSRTQYVLQQGQGDVDLAIYRSMYGKGKVQSAITAVEQAGYTNDYVTPALLELDNAVPGSEDGRTVLAADGPSYKALVIEPLPASGGQNPSPAAPSEMPLDTAEKIVEWAKAGLPVVVLGERPSKVNSYPGDDENVGDADALAAADERLGEYMDELVALPNVRTADDRAGLVAALGELGVSPDAQLEQPSDVYFNHRATDDADYYFVYNDGAERTTQQLTLEGEGRPYLLDPWSGDITPLAQYTAQDGSVTVEVDLEPQATMLIALGRSGWNSTAPATAVVDTNADGAVYDDDAQPALRTAAGGELSATLTDGTTVAVEARPAQEPLKLSNWKMTLDQWTAGGDGPYDTEIVKSAEYDTAETGLVPWFDMDPENLTKASGVATYTTSFDLDRGWAEGQGAYLDFTDVADVVRLFVNDTEVKIDQLSHSADIGRLLVEGDNTVKAVVTSNLSNASKWGATCSPPQWGPAPGGDACNNRTADDNTYAFGIIGDVTVTPYTQVSTAPAETENPNPTDDPSPTTDPTDGPSPSDSSPDESGKTDSASKSEGELAHTGSPVGLGTLIAGVIAVAVGAVVYVVGRRRRRAG